MKYFNFELRTNGTNMRIMQGISLLVWFLIVQTTAAAQCSNSHFGENDPKSKDDEIEYNTGFGYMMGDSDYIVDCCGIVDRWEAYFWVSGTQTVYFQVWRPTSGTSYELIGQNSKTVSSSGEQSLSVAESDRITIKSGDRWGWWTSGSDIITYKDGGGEEDDNYMMSLGSTSVGDVVNWGSATIEDNRSYGIRMETLPNDDPSFTNLPASISIAMSTASGTSLYTVSVDDVNTDDVSSLSVSMTSTTKYSFDSSSYILSTASSLTSSVDTLQFTVTDQCSNTATATLRVIVFNEPPEIHNLPASNSVREDETAEILLHTINATDIDGSVSCSYSGSDPFTVKLIPSSTSYGIYSDSNPGFDYNTQDEYSLSISCTDGEYAESRTFTVYLVKNVAPTIVNLQNSTSVSTSSAIGSNAFTVLVSDPEDDDLSFSMTCDPTPCPFVIFDSGDIQISEDLSAHSVAGYDIFVTVSDGRNTVGPSTLTITITDINDPVAINNLPVTKVVPENTVAGTTVYDVDYTDMDTSQAHSFSMTSSPASGLSYFSIDSSSGVISVYTSPDYDVMSATAYVMTVVVNDPVSSDTGTVTVGITNVNEAPSLSQGGYTLSTTESSAGTVIGTPAFGVADPDVGDAYTLSLDCGTETGYFSMDSSSGQVSFQSNYDLDSSSLPNMVTCTVNVTDVGGLMDTATLDILIDYINDNTPVFSPVAYTFHVSYYAVVGSTVGSVTATDADAGSHGVITYTLDQTSLSDEYFTVSTTGEITVKASLNGSPLGYASTVTISSTASDVEGLSDTATIVIAISDTTTTSTTTTTMKYKTFLSDSRNITWFTLCVILLVGCLILMVYIITTCHGVNGCSSCMKTWRGSRGPNMKKWKPSRHSSDVHSIHSIEDESQTSVRHTVRQPPPPSMYQPWRSNNM